MEKLLSSYAIIPDSLYIERSADRQLARSILDMGKPPYVLVARQMGKTNLLLNAKRRLQTKDDVFSYLDLTRRFPTLNDFFEYVIERILDTNLTLREVASEEIARIRRSADGALPAITYEKCLLTVLNYIRGRLVIIFDEVDSLANCAFSDSIFSQIRSLYFERSNENLKALQRLTYVLSGVAEPRELIKDRSISPFNIGDRIVLDDFSRLEVDSFAERAKLNLSTETLSRLYGRTSGNPRMIWDICSQLEDMLLSGVEPGPEDVEEIVDRLYFGDLPSPPIDHIRALVVDDRDLRTAVNAIHSGNFSRIGEAIRSKLFLAGIARTVTGEVVVEWRNGIVRQSLSLEWLATLPSAVLEALQRFDSAFAASDFAEAEKIFRTEVHVSEVPLTVKHQYLLKRAQTLLQVGQSNEALAIVEAFESDASCPYTIKMNGTFLRARFYADSGKDAEALEQFRKVASSEGDVEMRAFAKYGVAACLLRLRSAGAPADQTVASLQEQAVGSLREVARFVEERRKVLSAQAVTEILGRAYLSLGQILHSEQAHVAAIEALKKSIDDGSEAIKLRGARELLGLLDDDQDRRSCLEEACKFLVDHEGGTPGKIADVERQVIVHLGGWASKLGMHREYDALLSYSVRSGMVENDSLEALKLEIWIEQDNPTDTKVLEDIVDSRSSLIDENVGLALVCLVRAKPTSAYIQLFLERLDCVTKQHKLTHDDFAALHSIFLLGNAGRQVGAAAHAAEILKGSIDHRPYHEFIHLWYTIYYAAIFLHSRRDLFWAEILVEFFVKYAPISLLERNLGKIDGANFLKRAKSFSASVKREKLRQLSTKKIGRNDMVRVEYADGRIVTSKFKRVEDDIKKGNCTLVP